MEWQIVGPMRRHLDALVKEDAGCPMKEENKLKTLYLDGKYEMVACVFLLDCFRSLVRAFLMRFSLFADRSFLRAWMRIHSYESLPNA